MKKIFLNNPDYFMKNKDIQEGLKNLYNTYVSKIFGGDIKFVPWWENVPSIYTTEELPYANSSVNTLERCGYVAYRQLQETSGVNPKYTWRAETDKLVYKTLTYGTKKYQDDFYEMRKNIKPLLNVMVDVLNENEKLNYKNMGVSNNPLLYKSYMGNNGYMGWHTNCDKPGYRWYLVYNTHEKQSFFRWIDENKIYSVLEPKGWSINRFKVTDCNDELWHSIFTFKERFSLGIWGGDKTPLDLDNPEE